MVNLQRLFLCHLPPAEYQYLFSLSLSLSFLFLFACWFRLVFHVYGAHVTIAADTSLPMWTRGVSSTSHHRRMRGVHTFLLVPSHVILVLLGLSGVSL